MRMSGLNMPVRRKLLAVSMAYLTGIYAAELVCVPHRIAYGFCALFLCAGMVCLTHRRSALPFVLAAFLLLGNGREGSALRLSDEPTQPGTLISGTVFRIVSDTRIYLSDVQIDGAGTLNRPAVVTLMREKDTEGNPVGEVPSVFVGQRVTGTGRLFGQQGRRNPGDIDERIQALIQGYELSGYLLPGWKAEGDRCPSVAEAFRQARLSLSRSIEALFGAHAPLFQAMLIGDKSNMEDELVQAMRLTGIVHILTISGMHMSLMALALHALLSKLHIGRWLRFSIQAALLGFFVGLTGCAIGTIRAYIMALLREFAPLKGRRYEPLTALGCAAMIMTFACPLWALSASFQFSFLIVLGILLLSGQLCALAGDLTRCPAIVRLAVSMIALTASAQLAAMPMQLEYYGYIPMLAMPMNLISGLLLPVLMLGGWGTLAIRLLYPSAACAMAGILGGLAGLLEEMSLSAAAIPWGIVRFPAPGGLTLMLIFALLFLVSRQIYIPKRRVSGCAFLAAAILVLYLLRFDPAFRYVQLDVGQGDGAVLRKNREAVLVDVGPEHEYAALRYLRHEGLHAELVILTHTDADHAGALGMLLDSELSISRIALPVGALEKVGAQAVLDALNKAKGMGVKIELYERGDVLSSGSFAFSVLSPDDSLAGENERSLVLYTETDGMRILMLGDLPEKCEMEEIPRCDVLKVAHHGSRYATSRSLLEKAQPEVAVISVGRNSYGHPADRVLEDLMDVGAATYRTDLSGCVTVRRGSAGCMVTCYTTQ